MIKNNVLICVDFDVKTAAELVALCNKVSSNVHISYNNNLINAKSIMGVISLNLQKNQQVELLIEGADQDEAAKKLRSQDWLKFLD